MPPTRLTLVHDWLTGMRGGEKCLEAVARRWPDAPLLTLLHAPGSVTPIIEQRRIRTSFLQRLPQIARWYRYTLPLMPWAIRSLRPTSCDLVVSFSHCVAKAVPLPSGVPHLCYCFTPMRYAWHLREAYFAPSRWGRLQSTLIDALLQRLREWDRATAANVTQFVAISRTIAQRIRECYDRDSIVIYPPVDVDFYTPAEVPREDFYLVVSAFAPYKRFDLAIDACRRLRRKLVLIGSGQEARRLVRLAEGASGITFLGWQSDEVIRDHFRRCRALLFPGEEDFGIVPVEAQACGAPVIAYGRGGVTETIRGQRHERQPTGVFFHEATVDALIDAIEYFERNQAHFDPRLARRQALPFATQRYEAELFRQIDSLLGQTLVPRQAA